MKSLPSVSYLVVLRALQRDGWMIVRQRGSHIRLQKRLADKVLKLTVPAHSPIKRHTLSLILKQAQIDNDRLGQLR